MLVAGGSAAALAAAIAAANTTATIRVCLLENTDWPGGQLTSSGVSAIDYGADLAANPQRYLPATFRAMMDSLGTHNPGRCPVGCTGQCLFRAPANSTAEALVAVNASQCYLPSTLARSWIPNTLQSLSANLRVFLMTALANVTVAGTRVTGATGIQRSPRPGHAAWTTTLSEQLADWLVGWEGWLLLREGHMVDTPSRHQQTYWFSQVHARAVSSV